MKAIVEIVPGKDPKLCDIDKCMLWDGDNPYHPCALNDGDYIWEDNKPIRCQACLDATAEYEALQNAIAERDEALRLSRDPRFADWTADDLLAKAGDNLAEEKG